MKIHKNTLIAVVLLAVTGNAWSMKAMHNISIERNTFPFDELPLEMQRQIFVIALNNEINALPETAASLFIAAQKVRDFALINEYFNITINQPKFCLELIKRFAKKFKPSEEHVTFQQFAAPDMDIARALGIKCAQARYNLQQDFMKFIKKHMKSQQFPIDTFNDFLVEGVDVNFTYSADKEPVTILLYMIDKKGLNIALIDALIQAGADVNYRKGLYFTNILQLASVYGNSKKITNKQPWIDIIKLLLSAGAVVDKRDIQYSPILQEALRQLEQEQK